LGYLDQRKYREQELHPDNDLWDGEGHVRHVGLGIVSDLLYPELFPEYTSLFVSQTKIRGFKRAILSTFRSGILQNQQDVLFIEG